MQITDRLPVRVSRRFVYLTIQLQKEHWVLQAVKYHMLRIIFNMAETGLTLH